MSATVALSTGQKVIERRSSRLPRALKVGAAALALLYIVAGVEIAANYAVSPQAIQADLGTRAVSTVWTGIAWPVVLHTTMIDEPMRRLGPLAKLGS